jgi:hypothetical protein
MAAASVAAAQAAAPRNDENDFLVVDPQSYAPKIVEATGNTLLPELAQIVAAYLHRPEYCFGPNEYLKLLNLRVRNAPLPPTIDLQLRANQRVIYIPDLANGEPFTLSRLQEIFGKALGTDQPLIDRQPIVNAQNGRWVEFFNQLKDTPITTPGWHIIKQEPNNQGGIIRRNDHFGYPSILVGTTSALAFRLLKQPIQFDLTPISETLPDNYRLGIRHTDRQLQLGIECIASDSQKRARIFMKRYDPVDQSWTKESEVVPSSNKLHDRLQILTRESWNIFQVDMPKTARACIDALHRRDSRFNPKRTREMTEREVQRDPGQLQAAHPDHPIGIYQGEESNPCALCKVFYSERQVDESLQDFYLRHRGSDSSRKRLLDTFFESPYSWKLKPLLKYDSHAALVMASMLQRTPENENLKAAFSRFVRDPAPAGWLDRAKLDDMLATTMVSPEGRLIPKPANTQRNILQDRQIVETVYLMQEDAQPHPAAAAALPNKKR